jgi:hypothetical protein
MERHAWRRIAAAGLKENKKHTHPSTRDWLRCEKATIQSMVTLILRLDNQTATEIHPALNKPRRKLTARTVGRNQAEEARAGCNLRNMQVTNSRKGPRVGNFAVLAHTPVGGSRYGKCKHVLVFPYLPFHSTLSFLFPSTTSQFPIGSRSSVSPIRPQ